MGRRLLGSRYAVMMDDADISITWRLILLTRDEGRGLGKRLVDECLEGLRQTEVKRVIIMVADDNPRGRGFWRRSGWEEVPSAISMGIDL
jgi:ribosomal protein S18 acetylase RimI-like enzyme